MPKEALGLVDIEGSVSIQSGCPAQKQEPEEECVASVGGLTAERPSTHCLVACAPYQEAL